MHKKTPINMKQLLLILLLSSQFIANAQRILLLNGTAHIGDGQVLESAAIGVVNDRILFIKNALTQTFDPAQWDTIIQLKGQHIYPALISANNTLGLTEIDAVRATRDFNDVGVWNPHVRAQIAFNVESRVIETVRTNGVLISQATPRGGYISGTSSLMNLYGWNWEDATIVANDGIHLNWPYSKETYQKEKQEIYQFFEMAKAYADRKDAQPNDLRLEAMKACFKGQKRVYIHAESLQQIVDVIDFSKDFELPFPVIVGGDEAYLIGAKLKDSKIPIMLNRIHSLPKHEDDLTYQPYRLPALLKEQGILFCLQNEGAMQPMNTRNLPFQAGTTMAYGLTAEEALQTVSLNVCKIVGIDQDYGTLAAGKKATFFVSKGPALDMKTNLVTLILIDGKFCPTSNFQQELYQKYQDKYKQ
jgi:imidazolonepropionase-like amidohydrolase